MKLRSLKGSLARSIVRSLGRSIFRSLGRSVDRSLPDCVWCLLFQRKTGIATYLLDCVLGVCRAVLFSNQWFCIVLDEGQRGQNNGEFGSPGQRFRER